MTISISDISGTVVSRHDYMPFGEEVYVGIGGRTVAQGYLTTGDGVRQQFTGYERDNESGLDYAQARYFSSKHGRFTSVDPLTASANIKNPQTFNRYSYGLNSPYKFTDPLGLEPCAVPGGGNTGCIAEKKKDGCPECTWDTEAGKWVPDNENIQVNAAPEVRSAEDPLLTPGIGLLDTGPRTAPPPIIPPRAAPPIIPPRGAPPPTTAPGVGAAFLRSAARAAAVVLILPLAVILATPSTVQAPLPIAPTTDTTTDDDSPPDRGPVFERRGAIRQSLAVLTAQAEAAERNGFGYGISVNVVPQATNPNSRVAPVAAANAAFQINPTPTRNNPNHHTVIFPKPLTQETVNRFYTVFRRP